MLAKPKPAKAGPLAFWDFRAEDLCSVIITLCAANTLLPKRQKTAVLQDAHAQFKALLKSRQVLDAKLAMPDSVDAVIPATRQHGPLECSLAVGTGMRDISACPPE